MAAPRTPRLHGGRPTGPLRARALQRVSQGETDAIRTRPGVLRSPIPRAAGAMDVAFFMLGDMTIQRMDNVAIVVDDLDAAVAFFTELGMELEGTGQVEGLWADRTVGLNGVRSDIAMMRTPDGRSKLELTKYHTPAASG